MTRRLSTGLTPSLSLRAGLGISGTWPRTMVGVAGYTPRSAHRTSSAVTGTLKKVGDVFSTIIRITFVPNQRGNCHGCETSHLIFQRSQLQGGPVGIVAPESGSAQPLGCLSSSTARMTSS